MWNGARQVGGRDRDFEPWLQEMKPLAAKQAGNLSFWLQEELVLLHFQSNTNSLVNTLHEIFLAIMQTTKSNSF